MYNIEKATSELRDKTKSAWIAEAELLDGDIAAYISNDINNLFSSLDSESGDCVFFMVRDGEDYGRAILKILHAMPHAPEHSWYKLLNIDLSPDLSAERVKESPEKIREMVDVLAFSILESVGLTIKNSVRKIKIYGRTEVMTAMFTALLADEKVKKSFFEMDLLIAKEGRWLVVEKL